MRVDWSTASSRPQTSQPAAAEPDLSAPADVVVCERVRGGDFGCDLHRHPECEITLVVQGGTELVVAETRIPLGPGDLVFLGPQVSHEYSNDIIAGRERQPVDAIVVQFLMQLPGLHDWQLRSSMQHVRQLFERAGHGLLIRVKTKAKAASIMRRMLTSEGMKRVILLLHLLEILAMAQEVHEISQTTPSLLVATQPDRIGKILAYIEEHLTEAIYVEELARHVGLGKSAFSRWFKLVTGSTVPQHVNMLRIDRATSLLEVTDKTVNEIAFECGFVSPAHFQREFKRRHHCAPLVYRHQFPAAMELR